MEENKRIPYATWKVGDEEYKLKLTTSVIVKLEKELKTNLLNLVSGNNIPALVLMLKVTHGAMLKYHHGIKLEDVENMFDTYVDEGGSQTTFMTDVFLPIYQASGFFSAQMEGNMTKQLEEVKEQL